VILQTQTPLRALVTAAFTRCQRWHSLMPLALLYFDSYLATRHRQFQSLTICVALYGHSLVAGPSITEFARAVHRPETDFGGVFAARGSGYLLGSFLAGYKLCGNARFVVLGKPTFCYKCVHRQYLHLPWWILRTAKCP
jgi:hypothetical protein